MTARRSRQARLAPWGAKVFVAAVVVFSLFPIYWLCTNALKTLGEVGQVPPTAFPHDLDLSTFAQAWQQAPFGRYLVNSLLVALAVSIGATVLGMCAGYVLARGSIRGRKVALVLVLATMMVPPEALFLPNFVIVTELGWYDSYLALIVPWIANAFAVFLFRQTFIGQPNEVYEAAEMDGAAEFHRFRFIAVPLARSTVVTSVVITFVWSWNALLWPLLVTSQVTMRTLPVGLLSFQSEGGVFTNLLMAAVCMVVAPTIILFSFTQRFMIRGIMEGAVK